MEALVRYQQLFQEHLNQQDFRQQPLSLYEPVAYIMALGGKRMRPLLALMGAEVMGGKAEQALEAAMAVEVFHNFSLVHDDIMDNAPLRRGKETVHEKWNVNTGILSGDAMLIMAYRYLENYEPQVQVRLSRLFSQTALQVCEGQQWDMDFEQMDEVSVEQYLHMIAYKTAVLVGCALQMGAMATGAEPTQCEWLYRFGLHLGTAFQLQDDYLDAFGDPATFGKQVGGDIIENKKTYLYIKALEFGSVSEREQLSHLYSITPNDPSAKIESVKELFVQTGAAQATRLATADYTQKALQCLEEASISTEHKQLLTDFARYLMGRQH